MSLFKSETQKKAKKAQKGAESKVVDAGAWLSNEIGHLGTKLQSGVETGASALATGVQASGPYVQEGLGKAHDLGDNVKARGEKAAAAGAAAAAPLAAKAAPLAAKAAKRTADGRAAAQGKYDGAVAALAAKVGDANTSEQFDALVTKLTGDKKTVKRIQKAARKSAKDYAKKQKKAERGNKALLVLGLVVAGAVAGVAAWRASRPVQDPWKTPATTSARVSASPVNDSTTVAAGQGAKVDDVKDPTAPVNQEGTTSQAAHRASDGAKSVAEDAKQTVNEVKEQIKGSDPEDNTK